MAERSFHSVGLNEKAWGRTDGAIPERLSNEVEALVERANSSSASLRRPGQAWLATALPPLLLASWHDQSDVKLADALNDRTCFEWFFGLSTETLPERTAVILFRGEFGALKS